MQHLGRSWRTPHPLLLAPEENTGLHQRLLCLKTWPLNVTLHQSCGAPQSYGLEPRVSSWVFP